MAATERFVPPSDRLRLSAACHYKNPGLMELRERFLGQKSDRFSTLFYLWGHNYKFETDNNRQLIEAFREIMGGRSDVWYVANVEAFRAPRSMAVGNGACYRLHSCMRWRAGEQYAVRPGQYADMGV